MFIIDNILRICLEKETLSLQLFCSLEFLYCYLSVPLNIIMFTTFFILVNNELWQIKKLTCNSFVLLKFSSWISCWKTKENAFCKLCKREIVLSNMGEGALTSRANGRKHQTKVMDLEMNQ